MKYKIAKTSLLIMAVIFILGLGLIFLSPSIGEAIGQAARRGITSWDTKWMDRIINTNTANFQIGGAILSLVGGFGVLLSGYALYKEA